MHTDIKDRELQRQRAKAAKETHGRLTHRFQIGDLVMITVADTSVNPVCVDKPRLRWQGPCEVVDIPEGEPSNLFVRLLGDPATVPPKPVHWTRARRFAGKEFTASPRLIRMAQHDLGKFRLRDFLAWRVGDQGKVQLLAAWHGFEDERSTWEDIEQLVEDAPYRVRNYLAAHADGHPPLQQVYDDLYE